MVHNIRKVSLFQVKLLKKVLIFQVNYIGKVPIFQLPPTNGCTFFNANKNAYFRFLT